MLLRTNKILKTRFAMAGLMKKQDDAELLKSFFKRTANGNSAQQHRNLQLTTDSNVLVWSESEKQIIVLPKAIFLSLASSSSANDEDTRPVEIVFQRLTCSQPIPYEVVSMVMSISGQFIALVGLNGVAVLEMPRQWGSSSLFVGGKPLVMCRTVLLGDSLFRKNVSLQVLQLEWFPGSQTDSHILLLTNDNCLRCFDIADPKNPTSSISLSESPINFALAYGEVAVSFCIAPPISDRSERTLYPIFVLQENGNVLVVWSWLQQKRLFWVQKGPLKMIPESEDNYGGNFCSILCLQVVPSIIALATQNGTVHHCIVLDDEEKQLEFELDECNSSDVIAKEMLLYVYDSIELEKTLVSSTENKDNEEVSKDKTTLIKDKTNPSCYFCVNAGGAHRVNLPWIADLKELCLFRQELDLKFPSEILFLLCTQPTENSLPCEILGISSFDHLDYGTVVAFLLDNGEFVTRITNKSYELDESTDLSENQTLDISGQYPSPLKRLQYAGRFDEYIMKVIKRQSNAPIIKSISDSNDLSHTEFFQLLTKATNCMREEYIQKLTKANIEIKKRCEVLAKHKSQQMDVLADLQKDRTLSNNLELVAAKFSTVSENMHSITERLDRVVQFVQSKSPILSDAERDWNSELQEMQNKLMNLKRNLAKLKQKNENFHLAKVRPTKSKHDESQLTSVQLLKVKTNLKEQNNRIAELIEKVKTMNKEI